VNELRRALLDDREAPDELPADLRFLATRQASLAALFLDHCDQYKALFNAEKESGLTDEMRVAALDAAGNLGTLLQSLRQREDLQLVLAHAPGLERTPMLAIDQLLYSFVLFSGPGGEEMDAALPPEGVDELFRSQRLRDWLHGVGVLAPGE
jgi:hypothetical protein